MIYCKILHEEILFRLEERINEWMGVMANNSKFFEIRDVKLNINDGVYVCMIFYNVHLEREQIQK